MRPNRKWTTPTGDVIYESLDMAAEIGTEPWQIFINGRWDWETIDLVNQK